MPACPSLQGRRGAWSGATTAGGVGVDVGLQVGEADAPATADFGGDQALAAVRGTTVPAGMGRAVHPFSV